MLKVVDVIGVARTGAYEGDASSVTRTKMVRMAVLDSGGMSSTWVVSQRADYIGP
jgi:hypothetical protein